jgi:hypothetical protein
MVTPSAVKTHADTRVYVTRIGQDLLENSVRLNSHSSTPWLGPLLYRWTPAGPIDRGPGGTNRSIEMPYWDDSLDTTALARRLESERL